MRPKNIYSHCHIPDRKMVKKVQAYDPALFVRWNNKNKFFELWRHCKTGDFQITPITRSAYDPDQPMVFTSFDERILWWLYEADTYRHGGSKKMLDNQDSRWVKWYMDLHQKQSRDTRDMAKDAWALANNRYMDEKAKVNRSSKNRYPYFNKHRPGTKWIRPDSQARTSKRLMARSKYNARMYNYRGE